METSKEKYIAFANSNEDICIYNRPFWLDAVCGEDNWDAVVVEKDGEIVAAVPYHMRKKMGVRCVLEPQLTQCLEIWIKPVENMKQEQFLHYQFSTIGEVVRKLLEVKADFYYQMVSPKLDNWMPFCWEGFHQETRYTFIIEKGKSTEDILTCMSSAMRREIRQASESGLIEELSDIDIFYEYQTFAYSRRGMKNPVSKSLTERLYDICKASNACKILAVKENGKICCVGFYVYDRVTVYELLSGTDPDERNKNYKALMTYEMIKYAMETSRNFDFEGSMVQSIAENNRRFGAKMVPYYKIWKTNTKNVFKRLALKYKTRKSNLFSDF